MDRPKNGAYPFGLFELFVRNGHDVVLHSYVVPEDTPKGLRLFDVSKLMSETEIITHKDTCSLAIASDIYRYRIQREGLGLYVDCDVFCVRPFVDQEYTLTREIDLRINPAILRLPQDCQLIKKILQCSEDPFFIPPWLPEKKKRKRKIQKLFGLGKHVSEQQWGTIGPLLLTYWVEQLALETLVSSADVYSPMHCEMAHLLFEPGLAISDLITPRTVGMHLYNANLRGREIIKDTPLYEVIQG